jgi:hypothetical protein
MRSISWFALGPASNGYFEREPGSIEQDRRQEFGAPGARRSKTLIGSLKKDTWTICTRMSGKSASNTAAVASLLFLTASFIGQPD